MSALLLIGMVSPERKASCNGQSVQGIDALQFRTPYSLGELLHDGLVAVEEKIQEAARSDQDLVSALDASAVILEDLQNQYGLMVDKSNMHTMQHDDREFLQSMIDRIDQMIQSLESSRSYLADQHSAIEKNLELLSDLKAKLAN